MNSDLKNKRCPVCGAKVVKPRKEISECFQWKETFVCCTNRGHWVGEESACSSIKKKGI